MLSVFREICTVGLNLYINPCYVFLHILLGCAFACMLLVAFILGYESTNRHTIVVVKMEANSKLNMIGHTLPKIHIMSRISVQCCMLEVIFKHDLSE